MPHLHRVQFRLCVWIMSGLLSYDKVKVMVLVTVTVTVMVKLGPHHNSSSLTVTLALALGLHPYHNPNLANQIAENLPSRACRETTKRRCPSETRHRTYGVLFTLGALQSQHYSKNKIKTGRAHSRGDCMGLVGASFGWDSAHQCQTNCQMAKLIMFLESMGPRPSLVLHALLTHVLRVKYRQK